jgi:hypothetical protein
MAISEKTTMTPGFEVDASVIADWLDRDAEKWWLVDGDRVLMAEMDFPCPSYELSEALRSTDQKFQVFAAEDAKLSADFKPSADNFVQLADRTSRHETLTFFLSRDPKLPPWLLAEYRDSETPIAVK